MIRHDEQDMTAEQIKLIGDLLVPAVKDALHAELSGQFDRLRADLTAALARQSALDHDRFRALEQQVAELEALKWKALAAWGVIVLVGTWAFDAGWGWVKEKLFGAP